MTSAIQGPDTSLLSRYLTEDLAQTAQNHQCKSRLYCAAMIISAISAAVLFGGITAIYLGMLSEASLTGLGTLGVIAGACICIQGVDTFSKWQIAEQRQAEWHMKIQAQLGHIRDWDDSQIQQFFAHQPRQITQIHPTTMHALQQINPTRPLLALLPLIARYQVSQQVRDEWAKKQAEQINGMKNINQLPPQSRAHLTRIYQGLEAAANQEKMRYEQLSAECLNLIR